MCLVVESPHRVTITCAAFWCDLVHDGAGCWVTWPWCFWLTLSHLQAPHVCLGQNAYTPKPPALKSPQSTTRLDICSASGGLCILVEARRHRRGSQHHLVKLHGLALVGPRGRAGLIMEWKEKSKGREGEQNVRVRAGLQGAHIGQGECAWVHGVSTH